MVYVILTAQSALPDVAKTLLSYIEHRQSKDQYFFRHFWLLANKYINEGITYDVNFASYLVTSENVNLTRLYFKDYFTSRSNEIISDFIFNDDDCTQIVRNTNKDYEKTDNRRTQKVTTEVMMNILRMAKISQLSDDKTKIARLISYLTNFSVESIRQRMSNCEELTSFHKDEVDNINKILSDLNIGITIDYNKSR